MPKPRLLSTYMKPYRHLQLRAIHAQAIPINARCIKNDLLSQVLNSLDRKLYRSLRIRRSRDAKHFLKVAFQRLRELVNSPGEYSRENVRNGTDREATLFANVLRNQHRHDRVGIFRDDRPSSVCRGGSCVFF